MSTILIWLVSALYAGQVVVCLWNHQWAQALLLFGYVLANVGLILTMR